VTHQSKLGPHWAHAQRGKHDERMSSGLISVREKDVLKLLADGPTLEQLTKRINQQSPEVSSQSIGEVLVALQNKGYVFLDEGRWWRTPEGISVLDRIPARVSAKPVLKRLEDIKAEALRIMSLCSHGVYYVDMVAIVAAAILVMRSAVFAHQSSTFGGDIQSFFSFLNHVLRDSILQSGEIPLWNPYYFSGMPYLANPQTSPFYLSTPLVLLFGEADGIRWAVILHVVLSGLNMYYLMLSLNQSRPASLFSAVGYMFSGYLVARIAVGHLTFVYGYSWVPLAFAFCEKAVVTKRIRYSVLTGVVLAFQLQSGALIILGYTVIVLALYFVYCFLLSCRRGRRILVNSHQVRGGSGQSYSGWRLAIVRAHTFAIAALVATLTFVSLSAVKLIPMIEFVLQTARVKERGVTFGALPDIQAIYNVLLQRNVRAYHYTYGYGWWEFCAYLGPIVFIGIAAFILARRNRHTIFFFVMAFFGVIFAMGNYSPLSIIVRLAYESIPFFSALLHLPARFIFITVLSLSVLSGITVSRLFLRIAELKRRRLYRLGCFLVYAILVACVLDMSLFAAPHLGTVAVPSMRPYTSLAPHDLSVRWLDYPVSIAAGPEEAFTIHIKAKNIGDTIWLRDSNQPVRPGDPWYEKEGTVNLGVSVGDVDYREPLPKDIAPDDEVELSVTIPGRTRQGNYPFKVNFVVERVTWFNPPYPSGNLTVTSSLYRQPRVTIVQTPIDSCSQFHALVWLSEQARREYFRIGPSPTLEGSLTQMTGLGLFYVSGYETGSMQLTHYDRFTYSLWYAGQDKKLGLLNAKYTLRNQSMGENIQPAYYSKPWFVYENKYFLPRAYCVERAILIVGRDEEAFSVQDYLIDADYFDSGKSVLIRGTSLNAKDYDSEFLKRFSLVVILPWEPAAEKNSLVGKCRLAGVPVIEYSKGLDEPLRRSVTAVQGGTYNRGQVVYYSANKIIVNIETDEPTFMVLSEVYFQGWKAYVDGQEVPVMPAYSVLRSVFLGIPGKHEITFVYHPTSYLLGSFISLAALILATILLLKEELRSFLSGQRRTFWSVYQSYARESELSVGRPCDGKLP